MYCLFSLVFINLYTRVSIQITKIIADKDTSETAVQAQVYNVVLDNMNRVQYKASIFKAMKGQINTELLYYVWC